MKSSRITLTAVLALAIVAPLQADGELGDKAPKLEVAEWIKGEAVDVTDGKNIYVVEFWATWRAPCIASIPHLTELQHKYKDKNVTFIGVSTDGPQTVAKVKPFVKARGDKMDYLVALDKDNKTSAAYLEKFGIRGIPHAFIINRKGEIVWHDHPMSELDTVIDKVIAGEFDAKAAKKLLAEREAKQAEVMKVYAQINDLMKKYFTLVGSAGKADEASVIGRQLIDVAKNANEPGALNALAWGIMTNEDVVERDMKLALAAAEVANAATDSKDPAVMDAYGLALFENGKKKEAVKVQREAVRLAKEAGNDDMAKDLQERLERFEKGE